MKKELLDIIKNVDHPFYYYDLDALQTHLSNLKKQSPPFLKLWYATKANPLSRILQEALHCGFSFDVASFGEFNQVLKQNISPNEIIVTGPAKPASYFRKLLKAGVNKFVIESTNQLEWIDQEAKALNLCPNILLRLQLTWEEKENSLLGGTQITPFGLEKESWLKVDLNKYKNVSFLGFHVFQWGNLLDEDRLFKIWDRTAAECVELARELKVNLKVLDVGGGLGIPYNVDEKNISWEIICKNLIAVQKKYKMDEIWMELGRYAIGPFGYFVTRIIDKKIVRGQHQLVLESGINHLTRPMLTKQSFPCFAVNSTQQKHYQFALNGPLCTALDKLGTFDLPDLAIGDWVYFTQVGAYGFTESMPFFLGHALPAEVVKKNNKWELVRAPKEADTYLA